MSSMKNGLKALYGSKLGKLLPVLVVAGLVATASATVFVVYYGSATASAQSNDVVLAVGPDSQASCTVYPCGTATLSSTSDVATVSLSLGQSATGSPQPQTYYTDLLQINNPSANSHNIMSIQVGSIVDTGVLGSVTVYYCPATDPTTLAAISTDCPDSYTFTSTTPGPLTGFSSPVALNAGATGYFVIAGYASSTATVGNTVSFQIQIQWA
jgi:hypothetical protein